VPELFALANISIVTGDTDGTVLIPDLDTQLDSS
jgi:hypothetical protein